MVSQPGPNGWQLTDGGVGSAAASGSLGEGMTPRLREGIADSVNGFARVGPAEGGSVEGEKKGPVSREQSLHGELARPTMGGGAPGKLVDVMALVSAPGAFVMEAAAAPPVATERLVRTIITNVAVEIQITLRLPLILADIGLAEPNRIPGR
jgi:hypothetical protein